MIFNLASTMPQLLLPIRYGLLALLVWVLSPNPPALGQTGGILPEELHCEYRDNPRGIDISQPRLGWNLTSELRNQQQTAYRILVASTPEKLLEDEGDLWDSGKVSSRETQQIEYQGGRLTSGQHCYWKVKVWDASGQPSAWSPTALWSMGLLNFSDWQGQWISHDVGYDTTDRYRELYLPPARYLRKGFSIDKKIRQATVYATALGLYELRINGQKIGDTYFTPGWTDYDQRIYYNTYDVTDQLSGGENAIGAVIADGWYSGYIGYALLVRLDQVRAFYGENPAFMAQLEIQYEDGSTETIATDGTWKSREGPVREADLLMGETYDARQELPGWDQKGYNDEQWATPKRYTYPEGALEAYPGTPVRVRERLTPVEITEPDSGVYIFDLGKNVAGIAELQVEGPAGTTVQLRFGELLNGDGTLMTGNLRRARATDKYTLSGRGVETWSPQFTYHGFQYVEVTGLPAAPTSETITGLVLSSIEANSSTFECSNPMNNQLYSNIITTQMANFLEIPTDCPQRDERLGWTGDAQIFCRSATYNADVGAFFTKFLIDLDDAQHWYGAYPNFAPFPYSRPEQYSPAWMDAGVIIPYTMYKVYRDLRIVEKMYPGMESFMDFQLSASQNYLRPGAGNNWGDWLSVDEETSDDFIASAYFGYDAALMKEMAQALNRSEDEARYARLFANIKAAFAREYIQDDGRTTEDTQTSYALALHFGLYPDELAQAGADRLADKIKENGNKFSTGFLGTKHIMLVLPEYGYHDLAYQLFQQTEYPSWGYSVVNGSTSIWERWNSYTKDPEANASINAAMNSFSHYAFGSVAEWMFMYGLGIDTEGAGYRNIIINPSISDEMEFMRGSYQSINGLIKSGWEKRGETVTLSVSIPVNTRAKIHVPADDLSQIREGGKPVSDSEEIRFLKKGSGRVILEVGSGDYSFVAQ